MPLILVPIHKEIRAERKYLIRIFDVWRIKMQRFLNKHP